MHLSFRPWLLPLMACSFMGASGPAPARAAVPESLLQRTSQMMQQDSSTQRRFLLSYRRLQQALKDHDALGAQRQMHSLRTLLIQSQTIKNGEPNVGIHPRYQPVLQLTLRQGMDGSILLLPFQGPDFTSAAIGRLLVVHDIEPLTIASAGVRYLRADPPLAETAALIEALEAELREGRYPEARDLLASHLLFLASAAPPELPPSYHQVLDTLKVAEAFYIEACPTVASQTLEEARNMLARPEMDGPEALISGDDYQRAQERLTTLSQRLQEVEAPLDPSPADMTLDTWMHQLDS